MMIGAAIFGMVMGRAFSGGTITFDLLVEFDLAAFGFSDSLLSSMFATVCAGT
jgi:hypothetical protein